MKTTANSYPLLLRRALLGNASFSAASGLVLLLAPATVGTWLDFEAPLFFRILGVGLLLFAAELVFQATRKTPNRPRGWIASVADFSWVLVSGALLALFPGALSTSGWAIVLGVAAVVLVFGCAQAFALRRLDRPGRDSENVSRMN